LSICWVLSQSLGIAHAEAISFGGRRPVGPPQPRQSRDGATAFRGYFCRAFSEMAGQLLTPERSFHTRQSLSFPKIPSARFAR
jgi:hypothetical protein